MKTLLIVLLTAGLSSAAVYFVASSKQSAAQQEWVAAKAQWESEKAELQSALESAQNRPGEAVSKALPAKSHAVRLTPREILDKLVALKPGANDQHAHTIRLVVYYLQSLADYGPEALPAIREFLAMNQDIDYSSDEDGPAPDQQPGGGRNRGGNNIWNFRRGGELRTDFVLPPSLRLGLVDVLKIIGGPDAEKILATTLETTGRGVEVAYIARVLEEMSPGKYRETALTVAKDLLTHPLSVDNPSQLDELSKGYLYGVLAMYGDTSFAYNAQGMLIADGRVDRNALNYLSNLLKDQAVPALYQAYNNPSLTNFQDKANIANRILNYAGQNPQANQLFNEIVANTNLDARMRSFAIARLAGGGFGAESPTDPQMIRGRQQLLQSLRTDDERMQRAIEVTAQNLNNLLEGRPVENVGFGRGGWGGGGRNRNGGEGAAPGQGF